MAYRKHTYYAVIYNMAVNINQTENIESRWQVWKSSMLGVAKVVIWARNNGFWNALWGNYTLRENWNIMTAWRNEERAKQYGIR